MPGFRVSYGGTQTQNLVSGFYLPERSPDIKADSVRRESFSSQGQPTLCPAARWAPAGAARVLPLLMDSEERSVLRMMEQRTAVEITPSPAKRT
eukprot:3832596-Rhodomonas_salina.1